MNAQISPQGVQKTMQDFERESAKMDMSEELSKSSSEQTCDIPYCHVRYSFSKPFSLFQLTDQWDGWT